MEKTHLSFRSFFFLVFLIVVSFRYVNGGGGGGGGGGDYEFQCIRVAGIANVPYCDLCYAACNEYVAHYIISGYGSVRCDYDSVNVGAHICTCCA
ncbi:hypothetical protein MKW98_013477 [Papaver atlanticum]|uniref:Uncharacterized protein n=1 Tax=Papaver atlanticum TaxID=357466 RepID=A0AAD4XIW3_9MAGN|nr:hypothetical protein MKW98_013477 [Papaver atlanticum]